MALVQPLAQAAGLPIIFRNFMETSYRRRRQVNRAFGCWAAEEVLQISSGRFRLAPWRCAAKAGILRAVIEMRTKRSQDHVASQNS